MAATAIQSSFGLLRWPYLAQPRASDTPGVEPRYTATFIFGGPNGFRPGDQEFLQTLMQAMDEACIAQWNVGVQGMQQRLQQQNKVLNLALKKNSDPSRAKHAGIGSAPAGFHFEAKTKFSPDVFDPHGTKLAAVDPNMFYDGAVVRCWVSAYVSDHPKSGPYVGINLLGIQFVQHGPKLGGVEINAGAVDPNSIPSDLPTASAPPAGGMGQQGAAPPPAYGQPGQPPEGNPGASWGSQAPQTGVQQGQQNPPAGGSTGFGF